MAASAPTRKDTFRVTLTIDGVDHGVWDSKTGGKVNGNGKGYLPGGMVPQIALGGPKTVDVVTLVRNYDRIRDHDNHDRLLAKVGSGRCVCKQRPLDPEGNAYGKSITWTGLLNGVDGPDHDSNASDAALITVEILADNSVTLQ